jgi:hypothetical protein
MASATILPSHGKMIDADQGTRTKVLHCIGRYRGFDIRGGRARPAVAGRRRRRCKEDRPRVLDLSSLQLSPCQPERFDRRVYTVQAF